MIVQIQKQGKKLHLKVIRVFKNYTLFFGAVLNSQQISYMTSVRAPLPTIPCQNSTFVMTGESTLTLHYHLNSIIYIMVHSSRCMFCGLNKFVMTCIHYYVSYRVVSLP